MDLGLSIVKLQLSDPLGYTSFLAQPRSEPEPLVTREAGSSIQMPLPSRKPAIPAEMGERKVKAARTPQRMAQGKREAHRSKPVRFATIGFNYQSQ
jgi:hypothetical protein